MSQPAARTVTAGPVALCDVAAAWHSLPEWRVEVERHQGQSLCRIDDDWFAVIGLFSPYADHSWVMPLIYQMTDTSRLDWDFAGDEHFGDVAVWHHTRHAD